ncbi:MAG TPA: hypothetical protein VN668_20610 [Stellaceae bacterium]|nr:hypothetical protein [Stellaceae bacterium]
MGAGLGPLHEWHDFYLLIGTASATLIGLMFVAASIGASYFTPEREAGLQAFLTPTVLHFSAVLVTCLVGTAPLETRFSLSVILAAEGVAGLVYACRVWLHMRRGGMLGSIDLTDRLFYLGAPLLAYFLMMASGIALTRQPDIALEVVALALVLLLLLGIRNAWDMTVWVVIRSK